MGEKITDKDTTEAIEIYEEAKKIFKKYDSSEKKAEKNKEIPYPIYDGYSFFFGEDIETYTTIDSQKKPNFNNA